MSFLWMEHQEKKCDLSKRNSILAMTLNIVTSSLTCWGGLSRDVDLTMRKLFGSRSYDVLRRMQKATISSSLNIVRTFKATAN